MRRSSLLVLQLGVAATLTACTSLPAHYELPGPPTVEAPAASDGHRTFYVDNSLSTNPCTRYDVQTRSCGGGRELAFNNLADANGMVAAGDSVLIRSGTYTEQVAPSRSGTGEAPIRYAAFQQEDVDVVTPEAPGILLKNVQNIVIERLTVRDSRGWGRLENAHANRITGNDFREALATGTRGGLKLVDSHYNLITDNTFYRGNDSIVIQHSDRNRVIGNHFEFARHSLFSIRCGNFNIVRNNYLHNERQKIGEIYDCQAVSDAPYKLDATKRNLIEGNHFAFTRNAERPTRYNGIQLAGQVGLIRNNLFKKNEGGAIHFAVYEHEALNNYGNRVSSNWFFDNRCYALSGSTGGGILVGDNRVIGNLLSGNVDCFGYKRSTMRAPVFEMQDNEESQAPVQGLPRVWLTRTMSAGRGTAIPVDDVLPFFDGFGLPGERGDSVQIESTAKDAFLTRIDYENSVLHFDRELSWEGGDGLRILETNAREPFTVIPSNRVVRD